MGDVHGRNVIDIPRDDDAAADGWLHPYPDDDEPTPRPWRPVDLGPVLDGTWQPPRPTVGRRSDGRGLFYPGRAHTIVSETEGGKTWMALSAALDEMNTGNHVVYLDFEDDEGGIVGRLLYLGAHRDTVRERFHYLRPDTPLGTGVHSDDLDAMLGDCRPTLGVIDGITEAMTVHGLDPLDNADAAAFGRILPRRITEAGTACASLDHVTKASDGRGRYALGAVHKLNALTGAAYLLDNRTPFGVGVTGRSTVRLAKDRPGQLRRDALPSAGGASWYGDLVLNSHGDTFAEVSVEPPHEHDEGWRPTVLMERIVAALDEHGALSQRKLLAVTRGNREQLINALAFLQVDGYVSDATPHQLLRPYSPNGDSS